MRAINKNKVSVTGIVSSSNVARNILGGPTFGTTYESTLHYLPHDATEPFEIYRREHNLVMRKDTSLGERIEVIYDAQAPYRAYTKADWDDTLKDVWRAIISFGISAILFIVSHILKLQ